MKKHDEIMTSEEYFTDVPDCIFSGNDYREKIEKACELTKGILTFEDFKADDSDRNFNFELVINGKKDSFSVQKVSDYVDGNSLIIGLNQILKNANYEGDQRFVILAGGSFDFGIAFVNGQQENELIEFGFSNK